MLFRLFFLCLLPTSFPIFFSVLSVWQQKNKLEGPAKLNRIQLHLANIQALSPDYFLLNTVVLKVLKKKFIFIN